MSTFQNVLSAFAAIVAAFFVIVPSMTNNSKAIGIAVVPAITVFSWVFWLLTAFFFLLFFAASRIGSKPLKVLLFWGPVTTISILGLSLVALFTYASMHVANG